MPGQGALTISSPSHAPCTRNTHTNRYCIPNDTLSHSTFRHSTAVPHSACTHEYTCKAKGSWDVEAHYGMARFEKKGKPGPGQAGKHGGAAFQRKHHSQSAHSPSRPRCKAEPQRRAASPSLRYKKCASAVHPSSTISTGSTCTRVSSTCFRWQYRQAAAVRKCTGRTSALRACTQPADTPKHTVWAARTGAQHTAPYILPSPGLASMAPARGVIMCPPVSVCHQVSTMGHLWAITGASTKLCDCDINRMCVHCTVLCAVAHHMARRASAAYHGTQTKPHPPQPAASTPTPHPISPPKALDPIINQETQTRKNPPKNRLKPTNRKSAHLPPPTTS